MGVVSFFTFNSLNILCYGLKTCSCCWTILMLLSIGETEWCTNPRKVSVYQLYVMKMWQSATNLQKRCQVEANILHTPRYKRLQVLMIVHSGKIFWGNEMHYFCCKIIWLVIWEDCHFNSCSKTGGCVYWQMQLCIEWGGV